MSRRFTVRNLYERICFSNGFCKSRFRSPQSSPAPKRSWSGSRAKWISAEPRTIAEYGPGEGVHSRETSAPDVARFATVPLRAGSARFSRDLERQFADDRRVHVINRDAASLSEELAPARHRAMRLHSLGHSRSAFSRSERSALCSRIPTTRLRPAARFIIYQVTNELRQHATFSIARNRSIACKIFRRCSSPFFTRRISPQRPCAPSRRRHRKISFPRTA